MQFSSEEIFNGLRGLYQDLKSLNREQYLVVTSPINWKRVIAGAGTGKTTLLIYRILYLIYHHRIDPQKILAITFTRKAAQEMRERLHKKIHQYHSDYFSQSRLSNQDNNQTSLESNYLSGKKNNDFSIPWMGTFHAYAWKILKESNYIHSNARILSEIDAEKTKWSLAEKFRTKSGYFPISYWIDLPNYKAKLLPNEIAEVYEQFQIQWKKIKSEKNLFEFDDFLTLLVEKWHQNPDHLRKMQNRYDAILVDEFQDTNREQVNFLQMLIRKEQEFLAVGDDWQSIYGFRHADVRHFTEFIKFFPESKTYPLIRNYRSTVEIIQLANQVLNLNRERISKRLISQQGHGEPIKMVFFEKQKEMITWTKNELLVSSAVILVRTNYLKDLIGNGLPKEYQNRVMTIHQSKGLEFDSVIVAGLEKEVFPHKDNDLAEERRLLFVALSRARLKLQVALIVDQGKMANQFLRELGIGWLNL